MSTIIQSDPEQKEPVKLPDETAVALGKQLEQELAEALWSEKTLLSVLDVFFKATRNEALIKEIGRSKPIIEQLIVELNTVFHVLGEEPVARKCDALEAHFRRGKEAIDAMQPGVGCDVAVITVLQKGLHYNIAVFETLLLLSEKLGLTGVADMIRPTLEDKKLAKDRLRHVFNELLEKQSQE